MENSMEVPQKTKNRAAIWSSNPTSGHISRQNSNSKRYMHPYVHSSTMHNSQDMETTEMPIDRWMDKDAIHTHNGILLSHKKEWNNAICSNMDGPRDDHTKWSKSERERQIPYDITYMRNLKYYTNELLWNRNRLTNIENRLVVAKGAGCGRRMEWEFGVSRCKLLYREWINNKVLLYSTGNYIQYPMINHNGKEYKKGIYIYIYLDIWITLLYSRN